MKKTLTTHEAAELLFADENANWTRSGAFALCEYLEELESYTGDEIDFCPVSIRCDFSQYSDLIEWANEQWLTTADMLEDLGLDQDEDEDDIEAGIGDFIQDRGTLIEFSGGIIVSIF